MKKKLVIGLFTILVVILSVTVLAASVDFTIPSRAELDPSYQGKVPAKFDTTSITTQEEAAKYPFVWWRDTGIQNNLWTHTAVEFTNTMLTAYDGADCRILVYTLYLGSNVVAIIGPTGNTIIGCGGSLNGARVALHAFADAVPDFQLNLKAIVLTDGNPETMWGASEFIGENIPRTVPVMIFSRANLPLVAARNQAVEAAVVQHNLYAYGPQLQYGPNGNLGVGSSFAFNPYQVANGMVFPNRLIAAETAISTGGVNVRLIPGAESDAGLLVWLPVQKVLAAGEIFGKYFPPIGGLTGYNIPATEWIATLDMMRQLDADILVSLHARPISGSIEVWDALTAQKDALQYVHNQTLQKINQLMSLDDIVATVQLPDSLRTSPWTQEHTGTVANAVRAVYHQYMGWFDWEVDSLNTLGEQEQSLFLVQLAGGPDKALVTARKYLQENTMSGIQKTITLCKAIHMTNPSADADKVYIQALRRIGYAQSSAQLRNYYLLTAAKLEANLP
ncbi:MAG: alkyl sulfatase dimerization domain-containing protein [Saccharofermentanales bacterium]